VVFHHCLPTPKTRDDDNLTSLKATNPLRKEEKENPMLSTTSPRFTSLLKNNFEKGGEIRVKKDGPSSFLSRSGRI